MKKFNIFLLSVATCLCVGCSTAYYSDYGSTKFTNDAIGIGDSKQSIIKKFGKPYIQEIEEVDGKTVETIGYKESMNFGYSLTTYFVFENDRLVKKVQEEEKPLYEIKADK